jgi:acylphosphatase
VHALVKGRVQNVGFRMFVLQAAERLRLSGWVQNLPDGGVELEAEGDDQAIDALIAQVRQGPRMARVDEMRVDTRVPRGDERALFTVR